MIHRVHSNNLEDLRTYIPEDQQVAGDIVLFFDTSTKAFNGKNCGMFRLTAGFSTSGKTDDSFTVIQSSVLTDFYWDKIQKNVMRGELTEIMELAASGGSYTMTHTADPNNYRLPSMMIVYPATVQETLTLSASSVSIWNPSGSEYAFPIYAGNLSSGLRLNEKLHMEKLGTVDIAADVLSDMGLTFDGFESDGGIKHYGDNEFIVQYNVTNDSTERWAICNKSTLQYRMSFTREWNSYVQVTDFNNYKMVLHQEEYQFHISVLDESSGYLELSQSVGAYEDWVPQFNAYLKDNGVYCVHHYHDIPTYWGLYGVNARDYRIHNRSGSSVNTNPSAIEYIGNNFADAISAMDRNFTNDAMVYRHSRSGELVRWNIVNPSGAYSTSFYSSPFEGTTLLGEFIYKNDTLCYFYNSPTYGDITTVNINNSSGDLSWGSYEINQRVTLRAFNTTGNPKGINTDYNFNDVYCIHSDYYSYDSYVWKSDPDTDQLVQCADIRDITWDDDFYETHMEIRNTTKIFGGDKYLIYPNAIDGVAPTVFQLREYTSNKYVSAGVSIQAVVDSVSITDISITGTTPANTSISVHVQESSGGDLYVYNSTSTDWEVQNDYTQGNTLAEFNAADHSKLVAQVGQSINLNIYLVSTDGSATPVLTGIDVDYSKGADFGHYNECLIHDGAYRAEIVSSTQTKFTNYSTGALHFKCGVYFIE